MLILSYFHLSFGMAHCSETYFIDNLSEKYYIGNQNVLLYKIINWWYDRQPEKNLVLCGEKIKCINIGNVFIEYTESTSVIKFFIQEGFADQLSIFKTCDGCFGPSYLRCTWQNKKYLGKGDANSITNLNQFIFVHIDKIQAKMLKDIEKDIVFVVEGHILGLTNNGEIALHNTGAILKKCPNDTDEKGRISPITVTIKNNSTDEIIAQYIAVWSK